MLILIKSLIIIICLISIWYLLVYVSVKVKYYSVYDAFKLVDSLLQKRYSLISAILSNIQKNFSELSSDVLYAAKLRDEAMTLGIKRENLDRRFAFDYELYQTMQKIIEKLSINQQLNYNMELVSALNSYGELSDKIKHHAEIYNKKAEILKQAVEVFPSSFVSRLCNIKRAHDFKI